MRKWRRRSYLLNVEDKKHTFQDFTSVYSKGITVNQEERTWCHRANAQYHSNSETTCRLRRSVAQ